MGRGASGIGSGSMNVDWDRWGKTLDGADMQWVYDKDGNVIGDVRDEIRFTSVEEEHPVTRAEVMREISGWKNDDGTYGDEDTKIFIAYEDGTFFDSEIAGGKGGYREKLTNRNVIGASISTPDYEMVWGGEYKWKGGKKELVPWTTHSLDENGNDTGKSNTYSGWRTTGMYRVRVKTTFVPRVRKEVIRKSKVRKVDW